MTNWPPKLRSIFYFLSGREAKIKEVAHIMQVSRETAEETLRKCNWEPGDAIWELLAGPGSSMFAGLSLAARTLAEIEQE